MVIFLRRYRSDWYRRGESENPQRDIPRTLHWHRGADPVAVCRFADGAAVHPSPAAGRREQQPVCGGFRHPRRRYGAAYHELCGADRRALLHRYRVYATSRMLHAMASDGYFRHGLPACTRHIKHRITPFASSRYCLPASSSPFLAGCVCHPRRGFPGSAFCSLADDCFKPAHPAPDSPARRNAEMYCTHFVGR